MRLLLDTHVFLWAVGNHPRLRDAWPIIRAADVIYVSAASIWEVAIKLSIGRLSVNMEHLVNAIPASRFLELPVTALDAAGVHALPFHHRDPFDRLLVAQTRARRLHLLTADTTLGLYSTRVLVI